MFRLSLFSVSIAVVLASPASAETALPPGFEPLPPAKSGVTEAEVAAMFAEDDAANALGERQFQAETKRKSEQKALQIAVIITVAVAAGAALWLARRRIAALFRSGWARLCAIAWATFAGWRWMEIDDETVRWLAGDVVVFLAQALGLPLLALLVGWWVIRGFRPAAKQA